MPFLRLGSPSSKRNPAGPQATPTASPSIAAVPPITKDDVAQARRRSEIESIERKKVLGKWNDYIGFLVAKTGGFIGACTAGLEILDPSIIPATIQSPEQLLGASLSLLVGPAAIKLVGRLAKAFG